MILQFYQTAFAKKVMNYLLLIVVQVAEQKLTNPKVNLLSTGKKVSVQSTRQVGSSSVVGI